ncbi:MAG: hypothetical protein ACOCRX_12250 [Candidatus Woesearchaeota archaeon]
MLNNDYRKEQLKPLNVKGEFQHKVKLRNPNNNVETFWLNISYDEFLKICDILNYEVVLNEDRI